MPRCSTRASGWPGGHRSDHSAGRPDGLVDLELLERELDDRVLMVAVMLVNNEIGVIQPIAELAEMAHEVGALMLCDAVQGLGRVPIPEGPDLVAISAHKIHGPKGIGALWMREGCEPAPLIHGGGQERGLRSGTLSPAAVRGLRRCREARCRALRPRLRPCPAVVGRSCSCPGSGLDDQRQHRTSLSRQSQHPPRRSRRGATDCRSARHRLLARFGLRQRIGPPEPRASRARSRLSPRRDRRSGSASAAIRPSTSSIDACHQIARGRTRAGASRRVTLVRFLRADGTLDKEVEAKPGQRLLDVAWAAREPLEGACEGVMACSTCHVIVDAEDFAKLPPASEEEEDLLDLAAHATRTSRLACQIILTEDMDTLSVRVPAEARNWMGR